jgi:hypothetical protein
MDKLTNFKVIKMCGDLPRGSYGQKMLKGQIFNVGYCSLRTESTCTQHCVQLCTERQVGQGNCTMNFYNKSQPDALILKFIFDKELYMCRTDLLFIIRSLKTLYAVKGICQASYFVCLPATADRKHT